MTRFFTHTAIGVALLAALAPAATGFQTAGAKTVTLTDKDSDAKVELAKGDKLVVKLVSNRTTGFEWVMASKENDKLKLAGKPTYEPPEKKAIGAGGTDVFTFSAQAPGEVEVELHYKRPFEKDKAPAKTYKFKVTIK